MLCVDKDEDLIILIFIKPALYDESESFLVLVTVRVMIVTVKLQHHWQRKDVALEVDSRVPQVVRATGESQALQLLPPEASFITTSNCVT